MRQAPALVLASLVAIAAIPVTAAVSAAPPMVAREAAGGYPCDPALTHIVHLRVARGSNSVQIEESGPQFSMVIGDCVAFTAIASRPNDKPTITAIRVSGGGTESTLCNFRQPAASCVIAIGLDVGNYRYVAEVNHGGTNKRSDPGAWIINPCFPPRCEPPPPWKERTTIPGPVR